MAPQLGPQSPHQISSPQLSVCNPQLPDGQPVDWHPGVVTDTQHGEQSLERSSDR
jgi:hypothetical protein